MQKRPKVLILTQQLGSNFGGIMQAFALQKTIFDMGGKAVTDNVVANTRSLIDILRLVKRAVNYYIFHKNKPLMYTSIFKEIHNQNTNEFISKNIITVDLRKGNKKLIAHNVASFDVIIVGSDQVWRKPYSNIPEYLLDFTKGMNIKRISYAASFGKDDLSEYGDKLIKKSAVLAKQFDAISVREDSGVDICKKYWGVDAVQLVDPTLLLEVDDYVALIDNDASLLHESTGELFTYVLDKNDDKQRIIDAASQHLGLKAFDIMPPEPTSKKELINNQERYALPHVTQWLKSFADANYVITDSFHGCVFSIIFNKPFIAVGNAGRGLTRFTSLLKVFNLEARLITDADDLLDVIDVKTNWDEVNSIKSKEKGRAVSFLKNSIGEYITDEGISI